MKRYILLTLSLLLLITLDACGEKSQNDESGEPIIRRCFLG